MSLASSSIYESAELMRDQLDTRLFNGQDVDVMIGQPKEAAATAAVPDQKAVLNLFFYKIQPPGFFPDTGPHETWRVRLHCLVTAFGSSDTEGEDELKIVGQVLRYFHENPTLKGTTVGFPTSYWLEVIFQPLSTEEINQLWATFGDVAYRPSLTYEVSLVPVEPKVTAVPAPPVVSGGPSSDVAPDSEPAYESPPGAPVVVTIDRIDIDLSRQDWAPAIAFIVAGKALPSVTRPWSDVEAGGNGIFANLWVAGTKDTKIDLVWQSAVSGSWADLPNLLKEQVGIPPQSNPENQLTLDPAVTASAVQKLKITKASVKPGDLGIEAASPELPNSATQFLIYARRKLADGSSVMSNPLILNITGSRNLAEDGP